MPPALIQAPRRGFRLLLAAHAVSVLGDNAVPVALAFAVFALGGGPVELGLVLASGVLATVACLPLGGSVADRSRRQRVMIAADLVRLASQATLATLMLSGHARVVHLALLWAVHGAATGFFLPCTTGLIPNLVPARRLQAANGLLFTVTSVAGVAGPAVGGVLVAALDPGWAIAVDAATFLASALLLGRLWSLPRTVQASEPVLRALVAGWREFRRRRWVWVSIADMAFFQLCVFGPLYVLGPAVAREHYGGASGWSVVLVAFSVGALLGGLVTGRLRVARPLRAAFLATLSFAPALALLGVGSPLALTAASWVAAGFALGFGVTLWETTLQTRIEDEVRSRVSAYDWMCSMALRPLGLVAAGALATAVGEAATFLGAAGLLALATALTLTCRDVRTLRSAAPAAEPELAAA
jgi:MFS family permease